MVFWNPYLYAQPYWCIGDNGTKIQVAMYSKYTSHVNLNGSHFYMAGFLVYLTCLQMMIFGPLSRVMMVRQPFVHLVLPAHFYICNWPKRCSDPTGWFYKSWLYKPMMCHSFWTPAVGLNPLQFCSINITLRSLANIEPHGQD